MASGGAAWLPTGALRVADQLRKARPRARVLAADFNSLPSADRVAGNAYLRPIVAAGDGDRSSHFVPWGEADMLFPTDFDLMGRVLGDFEHSTSAEFFGKYGRGECTEAPR